MDRILRPAVLPRLPHFTPGARRTAMLPVLLLSLFCLNLHTARAAYPDGAAASVVLGNTLQPEQHASDASGMAVCPKTGKLFVACGAYSCIRRYSSVAACQNAGAAEAVLGWPGFTMDGSWAGTGPDRMHEPHGLAFDASGTLWVADTGNHRVLRFDNAAALPTGSPASGVLGQKDFATVTPGTAPARMNEPWGVDVDPSGRLWVADRANCRVLWFDHAASRKDGASADGVAGQPGFYSYAPGFGAAGILSPLSVAVEGGYHGLPLTLWVLDGSGRILRYDNANSLPDKGASASGVLGQPDFDTWNQEVTMGLYYPSAIAVDGSGHLWVSDTFHNRILRFNNARFKPAGPLHEVVDGIIGQADISTAHAGKGASDFSSPRAIAVWGNNLWAGDFANSRILRFEGAATGFNKPAAVSVLGRRTLEPVKFMGNYSRGLAVCPLSGKLFVADPEGNRVLRFARTDALQTGEDPDGVFGQSDFYGSQPGTAPMWLDGPVDVAVDQQGRLWVADRNNQRVVCFENAAQAVDGISASRVLGQDGFFTKESGKGAAQFNSPYGITVDPAGTLWVSDMMNNRVLRFMNAFAKPGGAPADGVLGQSGFGTGEPGLAAGRLHWPQGLAVDGEGRLWVADRNNHRVLRFDNAASRNNGAPANAVLGQTGMDKANPAAGPAGMENPGDVTCGGNGRLWVSMLKNRVVRFENAAAKPDGAPADGVLGQPDLNTAGESYAFDRLTRPVSVAVDAQGKVWVSDDGRSRIVAFPPVPTAAIVQSGTTLGGLFHFTWSNTAGVPYQIQTSADLHTWSNQGPVVTGTGVNQFYLDAWGGGAQRRFFRIIEP